MTARALIVEDGWRRGVLAATRSLGRAGWYVGIGSPEKGLSSSSRYASRWHRLPQPTDGADAFVDAVARAVAEGGYDVVFAGGDAELVACAYGRDQIGAVVAAPPYDVVVRSLDKFDLVEAADAAGIAAPRTVPATEPALDDVRGPVVVKARRPWLPGERMPARFEAAVVNDAEAARTRVDAIRWGGGEPLLQQHVAGTLVATVSLVGPDGSLVAHVEQRATRTWPQDAGVSMRSEVVKGDGALREASAAVLGELRWQGLAELQFLVGPTGAAYLVDCNGRFYGSLALSVAAGCDLPAAWAQMVVTGIAPDVGIPRAGQRYHWLEGDLRRARHERRRGIVRDVAECIGWAFGAAHSTIDTRDPLPALRRAVRVTGQLAGR